MKKFLPLIIFLTVFVTVLAGQVVYKMIKTNVPEAQTSTEYREFENIFLHANYKDLDGKSVEMTKLDAPVVIYNFWASWCIPCLEEMPSMITMKNKFAPDKVKIIAINTDEDDQVANIRKTMKKINLMDEFIIIPDINSELVNQFKISAIPVTIVFHRGKVVHFSNGPMDFNSEEMLDKIKQWTLN
jgi:thiol-disulfide isomerase/thioredoxin